MRMRLTLLFLCMLLVLSTGGVYATWKYAEANPLPTETNLPISLSVFDYPPEQILPGGNTEQAQLGENHFKLIDLILWESKKGYGLNINDNVLIHQYLQKNDVVFSNQKISGGHLKFILDPKNNTHQLYYCIEKVSDTLYYTYTFDINALATASGTTEYITVYRTSLEKSSEWRATTSYAGVAQTKRLSDMGASADSQSLTYSIDVTTWRLPFEQ